AVFRIALLFIGGLGEVLHDFIGIVSITGFDTFAHLLAVVFGQIRDAYIGCAIQVVQIQAGDVGAHAAIYRDVSAMVGDVILSLRPVLSDLDAARAKGGDNHRTQDPAQGTEPRRRPRRVACFFGIDFKMTARRHGATRGRARLHGRRPHDLRFTVGTGEVVAGTDFGRAFGAVAATGTRCAGTGIVMRIVFGGYELGNNDRDVIVTAAFECLANKFGGGHVDGLVGQGLFDDRVVDHVAETVGTQ